MFEPHQLIPLRALHCSSATTMPASSPACFDTPCEDIRSNLLICPDTKQFLHRESRNGFDSLSFSKWTDASSACRSSLAAIPRAADRVEQDSAQWYHCSRMDK
jgi:hypothetical protein